MGIDSILIALLRYRPTRWIAEQFLTVRLMIGLGIDYASLIESNDEKYFGEELIQGLEECRALYFHQMVRVARALTEDGHISEGDLYALQERVAYENSVARLIIVLRVAHFLSDMHSTSIAELVTINGFEAIVLHPNSPSVIPWEKSPEIVEKCSQEIRSEMEYLVACEYELNRLWRIYTVLSME